MKKQSFISKLFISIALTAGSVWLGAYTLRLFLIYNLFEPKDLALKSSFHSDAIHFVLASLLPAFVTPFTAYAIMIISLILGLLALKISFKENGWLFISLMIVLITLPFEVYLMLIDYKVIHNLLSGTFNNENVLILLRERITSLSGFPIIQLLGYLTIIFLLVFKPLSSKVNLQNEN